MQIETIINRFFKKENYISIHFSTIEDGYINITFLLKIVWKDLSSQSFVLQKVNTAIFKQPQVIIENMITISQHLKENHYEKGILEPIKSFQDVYLIVDENQNTWRLLPYIPHSKTITKIKNPNQAFLAAQTFSHFYKNIEKITPSNIQPSIPDFLNFEKRVKDYKEALKKGTEKRKNEAQNLIEFIDSHIHLPEHFIDLVNQNKFPIRIIHADPKLSNILFDSLEMQTLAVIDLDTIMPGTILYDYGEMIRSYTNNHLEDDPSVENKFNIENYHAVTQGFLYYLNDSLTPIEKENMAYAAQVIIYIQALRFLTDYLNNDQYYKTDYPTQNLNRTINQIQLLKEVMSI